MFYETGLIDEAASRPRARRRSASPIRRACRATDTGLPRSGARAIGARLSGRQLQRAGLSVYTTLAPSTQTLAEQALTKTLDGLGKSQPELQGAMVVTGARDGEVQALIGARDAADPGFDRALDARRPIGSLIKPFVYLVALSQPQKYSLATLLDDSPRRHGPAERHALDAAERRPRERTAGSR